MDEPLLNTHIGNFLIEARIKAGGVAVVYRVTDTTSNEEAALKLLQSSWAEHDEVIQRFEREAIIMAELIHPHIVTYISTGRFQRQPYIVMEYLPGGSLSERLRRVSHISLGASAKLVSQVASALDYAHLKGIVHRDLKPGNILLRDEEHAVLTDFGIARVLERTHLTMTGYMPGTPHYMSPEQARGAEELGKPSDIYSLAIITYLLITGKLPFTGTDPLVIINQHLTTMPASPSSVNPDLPPAVDDVLLRALAKKPDERPESASDFSKAFFDAINGHEQVVVQLAAGKKTGEGIEPLPGEKVFSTDAMPGMDIFSPGYLKRQRARRRRLQVAVALVALFAAWLVISSRDSGPGLSASNTTRTVVAATAVEQTQIALLETELALSATPTFTPTLTPTNTPTDTPTLTLTYTPTFTPSDTPTITPTFTPSDTPTFTLTPTPTLTLTPTFTLTPTLTLTPSITPPPIPTYAPQSAGELLRDFLDQDSPSAFNCVTFAKSFEFLAKQLENNDNMFVVARSLIDEGTATFRIYADFCESRSDDFTVDIGNTLFSDMRDEVQDVLDSLPG